MTTGEKLHNLRRYLLKMPQGKFAKEVEKTTRTKGLYQEIISKYETGTEPIKEQHLTAFASFFTSKYGNEITVKDLKSLTIEELAAKMEGKVIEFSSNILPIKDHNKTISILRRSILVLIAISLFFICFKLVFSKTNPPFAKIIHPQSSKILKDNIIEVKGTVQGQKGKHELWIFIEKSKDAKLYLWPKSKIENFQNTSSTDSLTWMEEIYHYPNPSDSLLYGNKFSISLIVIPSNKATIIKNWFKECIEIGHYPPLDSSKASIIIQYRKSMVGGLEVSK